VPLSAPRPCSQPGCRALVRGGPRCPEHARKREQERGTATQRGYDSRWRKARLAYLKRHPLCVLCEKEGRVTAAEVVDHIRPHRGDSTLFWAVSNWQPLCKPHHDRKTATEDGGFGR
jgi:5-methylcytosine-specific restriction protein A